MAVPAGATEVQPSLEVTTWPARIVQLVHPDGSKTCLFFQGETHYMPDGCVLAIHGTSSFNDTLNDILEELP
ncbi:MAG: hypothetical protein M3271_11400 [Actinomycetota bacterium]|nr:hypothetical protein [Actinomycetota bacterium]